MPNFMQNIGGNIDQGLRNIPGPVRERIMRQAMAMNSGQPYGAALGQLEQEAKMNAFRSQEQTRAEKAFEIQREDAKLRGEEIQRGREDENDFQKALGGIDSEWDTTQIAKHLLSSNSLSAGKVGAGLLAKIPTKTKYSKVPLQGPNGPEQWAFNNENPNDKYLIGPGVPPTPPKPTNPQLPDKTLLGIADTVRDQNFPDLDARFDEQVSYDLSQAYLRNLKQGGDNAGAWSKAIAEVQSKLEKEPDTWSPSDDAYNVNAINFGDYERK